MFVAKHVIVTFYHHNGSHGTSLVLQSVVNTTKAALTLLLNKKCETLIHLVLSEV